MRTWIARIGVRSIGRRAKVLSVCMVLAGIALPRTNPKVERSMTEAILSMRTTECEYRGIKTTFENMTKAYGLQAFSGTEFLGWEAEPDPDDPLVDTLVRGRFRTEDVADTSNGDSGERRRRGVPSLEVSWRGCGLGEVDIVPDDFFARDAVQVFKDLVDGFLARTFVTLRNVQLRDGPGLEYEFAREVEAGKALTEVERRGDWWRMRIPATDLEGWVERWNLKSVEEL